MTAEGSIQRAAEWRVLAGVGPTIISELFGQREQLRREIDRLERVARPPAVVVVRD
jgi:hypothetical protein